MSLLEAMYCGCVPVVSNVGDIVDVIRHGTNGFVFNDVDSEMELAGCLMRLLSDKELVDKTSREARKIVESISVEGNAGIWDNVFARYNSKTMKITLVGDIFPADEFLSVGFGIRSQFEATKGERWKDNIQGITQDSDIVIGNLESPLMEPSLATGKPDLYGSPEFARFLRECGIGVLNVGKQSYTGAWERRI